MKYEINASIVEFFKVFLDGLYGFFFICFTLMVIAIVPVALYSIVCLIGYWFAGAEYSYFVFVGYFSAPVVFVVLIYWLGCFSRKYDDRLL